MHLLSKHVIQALEIQQVAARIEENLQRIHERITKGTQMNTSKGMLDEAILYAVEHAQSALEYHQWLTIYVALFN